MLPDTLRHLVSDEQLSSCEILVVSNGSIDKTAEVTEKFSVVNQKLLEKLKISFFIIDTEKASKTNAINLGLLQAKHEVVVLLDADILIHGKDIKSLVLFLKCNALLAAAPKVRFIYHQSSWFVKQYFEFTKFSNYNLKHRLSNVIALSKKGIEKVGELPEIIADDEYIRRRFRLEEYKIVNSLSFDFICPKNVENLLQVLTRVERGNLQLKALGFVDYTNINTKGATKTRWMSYPIFLVAKVFSVFRAKLQYKKGNIRQWERDESNR